MQFLLNYGLFLAKAITLVLAILITVAGIAAIGSKNKKSSDSKLVVKKLNDRFEQMLKHMHANILSKQALRQKQKQQKQQAKQTTQATKANLFVIEFDGDIKASAVKSLREEINAILTVAEPDDQVLVKLDSGGGIVQNYGFAASQLLRIKEQGIPLTIAIDKVAASGGYMMACVADKIIAAPFAVVGSIGVVAQVPNFNRLLKKNNIEFEELTAGEYKRTLSIFGENNNKGRKKFQEKLEETHDLFKDFIQQQRPQVNLTEVATGEYWFAKNAVDRQLVDELSTSDSYLMQASQQFNIYEISYKKKPHWSKQLFKQAEVGLAQLQAEISKLPSWIS